MAVNDVFTLLDIRSDSRFNIKSRSEFQFQREWLSIEWIKHDDKMKKREKKNFHWTRMCLKLRLGPIDVNWKQSLFDGARESPFVFLPNITFNHGPFARLNGKKSLCSSSWFERFLIEPQREEKIASNIDQHIVEISTERSAWSEVESSLVYAIRFDTKPTAKQKCRRCFWCPNIVVT